MTPVSMQRDTVAGSPALYVEAVGTGSLLCLAHGFGGSARNWRPQARALADRWRTVVFDARGHARSEAPEDAKAYRADCLVDDFARVLDWALGRDASGAGPAPTPAVVGGLSMGAALALRFALAHPDRVRGLVLAAYPPAPTANARRRRSWAERFAAAIEAEGLEAAGAVYAWGTAGGFDPKAAALIKAGFMEHPEHAVIHTLREVLAPQPSLEDMRPALEACSLPALVLVGTRDELSLEPCRRLAALLPRAELLEFSGAGHVVNLERRREVSDAMAAFLAPLADGADLP